MIFSCIPDILLFVLPFAWPNVNRQRTCGYNHFFSRVWSKSSHFFVWTDLDFPMECGPVFGKWILCWDKTDKNYSIQSEKFAFRCRRKLFQNIKEKKVFWPDGMPLIIFIITEVGSCHIHPICQDNFNASKLISLKRLQYLKMLPMKDVPTLYTSLKYCFPQRFVSIRRQWQRALRIPNGYPYKPWYKSLARTCMGHSSPS